MAQFYDTVNKDGINAIYEKQKPIFIFEVNISLKSLFMV